MVACVMCSILVYRIQYTVMIRKNLLLCKLIRIKTSSKFLFDSYMEHFQPVISAAVNLIYCRRNNLYKSLTRIQYSKHIRKEIVISAWCSVGFAESKRRLLLLSAQNQFHRFNQILAEAVQFFHCYDPTAYKYRNVPDCF